MDEGGTWRERETARSLAREEGRLKGGCGVCGRDDGLRGASLARWRLGVPSRTAPGSLLRRVDGRLEATRSSHRFQLTALSTAGDARSAISDPRADRQLRVRTPFADAVDRQTGLMPSRLPNCCAVWIPPSPPARPLASLEIPCGVPPCNIYRLGGSPEGGGCCERGVSFE